MKATFRNSKFILTDRDKNISRDDWNPFECIEAFPTNAYGKIKPNTPVSEQFINIHAITIQQFAINRKQKTASRQNFVA